MKGNYFLNPRNSFLNLRNYFLNPRNSFLNLRNYFLNPRNSFLNLRNYFLNPKNNFLNPRNDFLIRAPNPETIYKTRFAVTNPNHWTRIPFNHLKSRDCPTQKNHLTKREKLPGCWCRRSSFSFVLCSLTFHLRIRHCYVFTFQSVFILYHNLCLSLSVYCPVWWFKADYGYHRNRFKSFPTTF